MKKPFYMYNGEKHPVLSVSYNKNHSVSHISIYPTNSTAQFIFAGKDNNGNFTHDEQLEQNIIWEDN